MLVEHREKIEAVMGLIDNIAVDPDIQIDYCIPEVLMTSDACDIARDPYVQFTYASDGEHAKVQHMPLKRNYLQKTPEDLANLITFSLEQFTGEIDSQLYGAQ